MRHNCTILKCRNSLKTAPQAVYGLILSVADDGKVFLIKGGQKSATMVYTPGAPETRHILKLDTFALTSPILCIADDGAVWALRKEEPKAADPGDKGHNKVMRFDGQTMQEVPFSKYGSRGELMRFDGITWHALASQPNQETHSLTPGKDGIMMVQTSNGNCILFAEIKRSLREKWAI